MTSWFILIIVIVLGTMGQISLKYAFYISKIPNKGSFSTQNLLTSVYFWIWFISYAAMTILWLFVLRLMPLNQAFPFLGLTYALVPLASYRFLKEKVMFSQWIGIATIMAGIVLIVQK